MSFGFSASDAVVALQLVKETLRNIKSAPTDFRDAEKTVQSLEILLESIKTEANSKTSVFQRDSAQGEQFANLVRLCYDPLQKLNNIVRRFPSLGSDNTRLVDRVRFSKRALIEIRGELSFRYSELSTYLDTIGLGGIGRLEDKINGVQNKQERILEAMDRIVAEARLRSRTASYLSDHSNDDKQVWKQLRRDLNHVGFKSADVERHKDLIREKLKQLQDYGLLDWDSASAASIDGASVSSNGTVTFIGHEKRKYRPATVQTIYEESETGFVDNDDATTVVPAELDPSSLGQAYRVWKGRNGNVNLKARLLRASSEYIFIATATNEEITLPVENLNPEELKYLAEWKGREQRPHTGRACYTNDSPEPPKSDSVAAPSTTCELGPDADYDTEIRSGKRDTRRPQRHFRRANDMIVREHKFGDRFDDSLPSAAEEGNVNKCRRLLDKGADIEAQGPQSYSYTTTDTEGMTTTHYVNYPETTALWRAANKAHFDTVHLLLRYGADANVKDKKDKNHVRLLRKLIEERRDPGIIRLLLEYEADVNSQDVLIVAAEKGPTLVVRDLLEHGSNIERLNALGETALYRAAWKGNASTVKALLQEGASVNFLTRDGQSPLYKAAGQGHHEAVKQLLLYGADVDRGSGKAGETVLYKACRLGHEQTVRALLRRGANPEVENEFKPTEYGSKSELLMHVLRPTERPRNEYGLRPLYAAARLGHLQIVKLLLEYGADVNAKTEDNLPAVYIAAEMQHKEVVQYLLKSGATLVDARFIDPVAKFMSNDDHESIRSLNGDAKVQKHHSSAQVTELLAAFRQRSLHEGGDGLKTIAKMLGINSESRGAKVLPLLALVGTAKLLRNDSS